MWWLCTITHVCATRVQGGGRGRKRAEPPSLPWMGTGLGCKVWGAKIGCWDQQERTVWLFPCQPGGPWHGQAVPSTVLTVVPSLADAVSSSRDCGGGSGCPEVSAAGAGPSASSGARSNEMQFGVETREHVAVPKPTPGARGARPKAKGDTCKGQAAPNPAPCSHSPGIGACSKGAPRAPASHPGAPHLSGAVSEPAWPPAASPPRRAAAGPRQTPARPLHCRSGAGSAGTKRGGHRHQLPAPGWETTHAHTCGFPVRRRPAQPLPASHS